jgi:hypothetical protein
MINEQSFKLLNHLLNDFMENLEMKIKTKKPSRANQTTYHEYEHNI